MAQSVDSAAVSSGRAPTQHRVGSNPSKAKIVERAERPTTPPSKSPPTGQSVSMLISPHAKMPSHAV